MSDVNAGLSVAFDQATMTFYLSKDLKGTYEITANYNNGAVTEKETFTVDAGPTASIDFQQHGGTGTGGDDVSPQPVIQLKDAGGNIATGDSSSVVTLTLHSAPAGVSTTTWHNGGSSATKTASQGQADGRWVAIFTDLVPSRRTVANITNWTAEIFIGLVCLATCGPLCSASV